MESSARARAEARARTWAGTPDAGSRASGLFDLREVELHGRGATKDRHQHADLLLLRLHVFDDTREVGERPVDHADLIVHLEGDPRLRLDRTLAHLGIDDRDVLLADGRWVVAAEEAGDLGR